MQTLGSLYENSVQGIFIMQLTMVVLVTVRVPVLKKGRAERWKPPYPAVQTQLKDLKHITGA
jgi:hypothetical protein